MSIDFMVIVDLMGREVVELASPLDMLNVPVLHGFLQ